MADDKDIMKLKSNILEESDDYPRWAKEITSILMVNDCIDAIKPAITYTREMIIAQYVEARMNERDVTNIEIKAGIKEENKEAKKRRTKAAGLI